jgi:phosphopantothenoylcysteine decarboxylase / phosphopantothenate---cysteine ligase
MGYAIAEAAAKFGADVTLISGPTNLPSPLNVNTIRVESAQEMYEQVMKYYQDSHIVIKSAAVADYRPKHIFAEKMKKQPGDYSILMERTIDILKTLGEQKKTQILVGFAAETERVEEYAKRKLESKNLDMIVANNVSEEGAGFAGDTNIVTIFKRDGSSISLPLLPKKKVAEEILKEIYRYIEAIR